MLYVSLSYRDVKAIVKDSLQPGGGGKHSPLEIALAKKCVKYHEAIGKITDKKAKLKEHLYSLYRIFERDPNLKAFCEWRNQKDQQARINRLTPKENNNEV